MRFVTKAPPISNIDDKCHIKKLKSSKTCLIGYSGFFSREWFLIAWGADTHIHTDVRTKTMSRNQVRRPSVPGLKMHLEKTFLKSECEKPTTILLVQPRVNIREESI